MTKQGLKLNQPLHLDAKADLLDNMLQNTYLLTLVGL